MELGQFDPRRLLIALALLALLWASARVQLLPFRRPKLWDGPSMHDVCGAGAGSHANHAAFALPFAHAPNFQPTITAVAQGSSV